VTSDVDQLTPEEFEKSLRQLSNKYITNPTIDYWRNALSYEKQLYLKSGMDFPSLHQAACDVLAAFIAADVRIIAGTDTPARPGIAGHILQQELAEYVRLGMSPWQALRSATNNVARTVEQEDPFGQIEANMRANVVLLLADPLEAIKNLEAIERIVQRGKILGRKQLDRFLKEVTQLVKNANQTH